MFKHLLLTGPALLAALLWVASPAQARPAFHAGAHAAAHVGHSYANVGVHAAGWGRAAPAWRAPAVRGGAAVWGSARANWNRPAATWATGRAYVGGTGWANRGWYGRGWYGNTWVGGRGWYGGRWWGPGVGLYGWGWPYRGWGAGWYGWGWPSYTSYNLYGYWPSSTYVYSTPTVVGYTPDAVDYSGYYSPPADTGLSTMAPATDEAPPQDNCVHLMVHVPADAQLWFDSTLTQQTGTEREFYSPPLNPGQTYHYDIRAHWTADNGQPVDVTRSVAVQANEWKQIDMTQPATDNASAPPSNPVPSRTTPPPPPSSSAPRTLPRPSDKP